MKVLRGRDCVEPLVLDADVVVIGSGAGGAVIATELAEAGFSVVVVEEGPFVSIEAQGKTTPSESIRSVWRDGAMTMMVGLGDTPHINVTMGRCVGGSSTLTGGVCFRIPGHILAEWRARRGLPEYTEHALEPFYQRVEKRVNVEEVPEALRSHSTVLFAKGARALGYELKPMLRNTKDCNGCGRCNFGCPHGAKLSVDKSYLPGAVENGALVVSDAKVSRVMFKSDRAIGVEGVLARVEKPYRIPFRVHASRVVVAGGAAFSPGVLARSGVRHEHLGRHVTVHPAFRMLARFEERVEGWKGALQSAYTDAFEEERITLTGLFVPQGVLAATMPGVGPRLLARVRDIPHLAMFGGMVHDAGGGTIHRGFGGTPIMTYRMAGEDRPVVPLLLRKMANTFFAAGAKEVFMPVFGEDGMTADQLRKFPLESVPMKRIECSSQHPLGSLRMGPDSDHAVVDGFGRVHGTRNLYVGDGSIVPTSLGVNPQLAIMTLATRVAAHLVETRPL